MSSTYHLMSKRELEIEVKRLEEFQHRYARCGLAVMAHSYAGKLVTATLILASKKD